MLKAPKYLNKIAKKEFERIVELKGDLLKEDDTAVLANYAQCYDECVRLAADVEREGFDMIGANGVKVLTPKCQLLKQQRKLLQSFANDLMLNPRVRNTARSGKSGRTPDGLDDILDE